MLAAVSGGWNLRGSRFVAMLLGAAMLMITLPADSADARGKSVRADSSGAYATRIFALINRERTRHGLQPLQRGRCATAWAERWSSSMAGSRRLRHQSLKSLLAGCGARRAAENVGSGNVSADDLMKQWMASRRHRANILHPKLGYVGVGAARGKDGNWYAVQDFLGF
jgi:uncharacterized protein YkwD